MIRYSVTIIFCLLWIGCSVNAVLGRSFDNQWKFSLRGDEILCEMAMQRPSGVPQGIYAIDPNTGHCRCLIPYAIKPIWSPDQTMFLFFYDAGLWVSNLQGGAIKLVSFLMFSSAWWSQDSKTVYYNDSDSNPVGSLRLMRVAIQDNMDFRILPEFSWTNADREIVTAIALSPDNRHIAYQSAKYIGLRDSGPFVLRIFDSITKQIVVVREDTSLIHSFVNPIWQRNGPAMAFEDQNMKTGERNIWIYDTTTGNASVLVFVGRRVANSNEVITNMFKHDIRILDWSADGKYMVVAMRFIGSSLSNGEFLVTVPLNVNAPLIFHDGIMSNIRMARWSPDGKKFAYFKTGSFDPIIQSSLEFEIRPHDDPDMGTIVKVPKGLTPIWIDW